uniref:Uncharacterized protein n=1 Tax=Wuchereria bancrofti TaxID=6293 RepID=A0A1I8EEK0_WUCBA
MPLCSKSGIDRKYMIADGWTHFPLCLRCCIKRDIGCYFLKSFIDFIYSACGSSSRYKYFKTQWIIISNYYSNFLIFLIQQLYVLCQTNPK